MAKLARVFQKLFGDTGNQSHFGQFGSRAIAAPLPTKDPNTIQALTAFTQNGWLDAINAANKAPFLEDMNGLFYLLFYQLNYGFQEGIPEWNSGTTYYIGGIVKKTGTTELYGSLVDANVGNALPSQTSNAFWNYLNPASVAPGLMSDFGGTTAPFGWLLCDGSVVSQASYPGLFTAIGTNWNTGGEGGGNFRLPDMRGRASIGTGQGSGLTNRTLATLLGEETHLLVIGEMPTHSHGVVDPGHNHTERGSAGGSTPISISTAPGSGNLSSANDTESSTTGITIISTGGGGAHNNMQPSAVVTKVIKT